MSSLLWDRGIFGPRISDDARSSRSGLFSCRIGSSARGNSALDPGVPLPTHRLGRELLRSDIARFCSCLDDASSADVSRNSLAGAQRRAADFSHDGRYGSRKSSLGPSSLRAHLPPRFAPAAPAAPGQRESRVSARRICRRASGSPRLEGLEATRRERCEPNSRARRAHAHRDQRAVRRVRQYPA
jgi:hypothetical protein